MLIWYKNHIKLKIIILYRWWYFPRENYHIVSSMIFVIQTLSYHIDWPIIGILCHLPLPANNYHLQTSNYQLATTNYQLPNTNTYWIPSATYHLLLTTTYQLSPTTNYIQPISYRRIPPSSTTNHPPSTTFQLPKYHPLSRTTFHQ